MLWHIFGSFLSDFLPPFSITRALRCSGLPGWKHRYGPFYCHVHDLALDVAFVLGLHMGTAGTALVTVIAQLFCRSVSVDSEKDVQFFSSAGRIWEWICRFWSGQLIWGGVCPSSVQYLRWKDAGPGSGELPVERDHFRIYGDHQNWRILIPWEQRFHSDLCIRRPEPWRRRWKRER